MVILSATIHTFPTNTVLVWHKSVVFWRTVFVLALMQFLSESISDVVV